MLLRNSMLLIWEPPRYIPNQEDHGFYPWVNWSSGTGCSPLAGVSWEPWALPMGLHEEYLNVVENHGAKELTDRRIADYIWELDNTGLTISRISSKRYGKERVVRLGVPINIITRILERLENG